MNWTPPAILVCIVVVVMGDEALDRPCACITPVSLPMRFALSCKLPLECMVQAQSRRSSLLVSAVVVVCATSAFAVLPAVTGDTRLALGGTNLGRDTARGVIKAGRGGIGPSAWRGTCCVGEPGACWMPCCNEAPEAMGEPDRGAVIVLPGTGEEPRACDVTVRVVLEALGATALAAAAAGVTQVGGGECAEAM